MHKYTKQELIRLRLIELYGLLPKSTDDDILKEIDRRQKLQIAKAKYKLFK